MTDEASDGGPFDVTFTNEPLDMSQMPRLADEDFVGVDPNYLRVSLIGMAVFVFLVVVAAVVAAVLLDRQRWIPLVVAAGLVTLTALSAVLRVLEVRHIGYLVRTHDLSYRSGVVVKRVSTVPFVRVQHARIRQGPLQRRFGLASLEVNSAGPDLAIHGLSAETAAQMKTLVVERAGDLTEDE